MLGLKELDALACHLYSDWSICGTVLVGDKVSLLQGLLQVKAILVAVTTVEEYMESVIDDSPAARGAAVLPFVPDKTCVAHGGDSYATRAWPPIHCFGLHRGGI